MPLEGFLSGIVLLVTCRFILRTILEVLFPKVFGFLFEVLLELSDVSRNATPPIQFRHVSFLLFAAEIKRLFEEMFIKRGNTLFFEAYCYLNHASRSVAT